MDWRSHSSTRSSSDGLGPRYVSYHRLLVEEANVFRLPALQVIIESAERAYKFSI
jgi:hypothetical protein